MEYDINIKVNSKTIIEFHFNYLSDAKDFLTKWLLHAKKKKLQIFIEGIDC